MIWIIAGISLLLTGLFAGFRSGFLTANKLGIELKKKQGKKSGKILSAFAGNLSRFITAWLVGGVFFSVVFGQLFLELIRQLWEQNPIGVLDDYRVLLGALFLVIGAALLAWVQFTAKGYFKSRANVLVDRWSSVMHFFYVLLVPFSRFYLYVSAWMAKYLFNVRLDETVENLQNYDVDMYYRQVETNMSDTPELNEELLENALNLPGLKVRNCLVPRKEIIAIDASASIDALLALINNSKLSRIIIYKGSIDNISGYVHHLDMFKRPATISEVMLPISAVPETMAVTDLMEKLSKEHKSIAWVVDEFGGTAGIVTMEDLLEEIFGEIQDEYDTDELVEKQTGTNEFLFSGRLKLDDLSDKYNLTWQENDSETLSGYIISQTDQMPKPGEKIILGDYRFEIVSMAENKIDLLKMEKLA